MRVRCLVSLGGSILLGVAPLHAQGTEIIRGKVTDASHKPIANADVTIVGMTSQTPRTTVTDDKGIYTGVFANGEGDYLIVVRKIGFAPGRRRASRTGMASVIIADISMSEHPVELDTLKVNAPTSRKKNDLSVGGVDQDLLQGALFSLDPTDLVKLASQVPGILALGDSAFSVLGAPSDQNTSTVDGLNFGGGNLPIDAVSSSKLTTTSADPRNGKFAGGQTATVLRGGSDLFAATTRANVTNSALSWTDPGWPSVIPRQLTFSGGAGGPIVRRKLHYQLSWNIVDVAATPFSLLDPPAAILPQFGLSPDSIAAATSALRAIGVPLTAPGAETDRHVRSFNTVSVIDYAPHATTSMRLIHTGFWQSLNAPGTAPFSYPSLGLSGNNNFQFLAFRMTGYIHGFLDELGASLNYTNGSFNPTVPLPTGSVRIGTEYADGRTGLTSLRFGGTDNASHRESYDWDIEHELSWLSSDGRHHPKIGQDLGYESARSFNAGNRYGAFAYQTLADLAANHPASYTQTQSASEHTARGASLGAWVGDEWLVSNSLQFQGGVRLDAAFPGTDPLYNPAIADAFGLHTDMVPHTHFITPRLGFSWTSSARHGGKPPLSLPTGGLLAGATPETLRDLLGSPIGGTPPGIGITGSFGGYGGTLDNGVLSALVDQTGLPSTRHILSCVGTAVPTASWTDFNTPGPSTCADGSGAGNFAVNQPSVRAYDPTFQVPITWRANLGIDGIRLPARWTVAFVGFESYGTNNESALDLNLRRTPLFTLAGEAGRPVYVNPDDIVPSTGAVGPGAYRINPAYGAVTDVVSDLHNETQQLQATFAPPHPLLHNKLGLNLTYVWTHGRQQVRGLSSGGFFGNGGAYTAGDPFQVEWVPGNQPIHQFVLNTSARIWWFNTNARLNVYSGFPYTPVVSGDINGDGHSNDRAFVANPALTADTLLASQMQRLIAGAPSAAKDCLERQMQAIAGYNSCTSGWQARLDLNLQFVPPRTVGFTDRLRVTMNMLNASGALVRLFGLDNTPLGRGALSTTVDNRLLYVTGFDPAAQRYKYQVNQLFGQPVNIGATGHLYPPFQLQLGLEYKFGGPQRAPVARGLGLVPDGREAPFTKAQLRDRLWQLSRNPIESILQRGDSIMLSKDQIDTLLAISRRLHAHVDSVLAPIMAYLEKSSRRVDDDQLMSRLGKVRPAIARLMLDAAKEARASLFPAQVDLLPPLPEPPTTGKKPGKGGGEEP